MEWLGTIYNLYVTFKGFSTEWKTGISYFKAQKISDYVEDELILLGKLFSVS